MLGLEDKVIVVTGGNRGIGAGVVALLEELGAKVAYNYRSEPGEKGSLAVKCSVTSLEEMTAFTEKVESELGPIYGVVANAGVTRDGLFTNLSLEAWEEVITGNLTGAFNTVKPIIPKLYERKEGALVFISSITGIHANMGQANYGASKAAVITLAKTLALEGARYNVRSNVVAPGFTSTDMLKPIPDKVKEKIIQTIPLRRFADTLEMAWATAFFLSPIASSYVTGQVLSVDGGRNT